MPTSYTNWTVAEEDPPGPDGTVAVRIDLSGGPEPIRRVAYTVDGNTTVPGLKAFIWSQSNTVARKAVAALITLGMTGAITRPPDPVPSAQDIWNGKVSRYLAGKNLALTNPQAITDLNALFADINATYQSSLL